MILNCSNITKSYGERNLFENASFTVEKGEIVGLIGANGVGKTTLFNIITGKEEADSGAAIKSTDTVVGYLEQHVCANSSKTAFEETVSVFSYLFAMEKELKELELILLQKHDENLILRQTSLIEEYERRGGLTYISLSHSVLLGLGFSDEEQNLPVEALSGGQKSKIGLAKLLLQKPDIMLLDEPTNHLDIDSVAWLERFIVSSKITAIVISHDRYFLDKICTKIVEIYTHKTYVTSGNYTRHMELKSQRDLADSRHYDNVMSEVKRLEGVIEQQRRWNREKNIKTAESKQKQIDRMTDGLYKPEFENNDISFAFSPFMESGDDVLGLSDLHMEFPGKELYKNVSFDVKRGEAVFVIGENGIGKTTLAKQILRRGRGVKFGVGVEVGYFDQHQLNLTLSKTVFDEVHDAYPRMSDTEVRSSLAIFGFRGDKVFETIEVLSGGERAKVSLCKLMLKRCNFLILDEPTNHLDIYSMSALEDALASYTGTLLVISHDRYFINKLATKIVKLKPDGVDTFKGNYDSYMEYVESLETGVTKDTPVKQMGSGGKEYQEKKQRRSELTKLTTLLSKTETEIDELEKKIDDLNSELQLEENATDYEKISKLSEEIAQLNENLDVSMERWEETSEKIENFEI